MVRSHAKNNTTQSTLSHYERSLLRKPNETRRLGADSFKALDACNLCLSTVISPVACPQGHVYCRECAISNLLTQKASIEVQKREMERWEENELREREEARLRARERIISDFEKGMGLGGSSGRRPGENGVRDARPDGRKKTMEEMAVEAEERAMKAIELEQAEARKSKLAAFWLPSMTPEAKLGPVKDIKLQTVCQVGGSSHAFSRKTLLPVVITYPSGSKTPSCPSCHRELNNAVPSILLSSRSSAAGVPADSEDGPKKKKAKKDKGEEYACGHVVCKTCADTIVKPTGRCCVCELEVGKDGLIPLGKEGTGFAAAGGAEVKRDTIVFRI